MVEILVQHCTGYSDHVRLRIVRGAVALCAIKEGAVTHRDVIEDSEEFPLACLHDGHGWYLPMVIKALRIMDDRIEEESENLPAFLVGRP